MYNEQIRDLLNPAGYLPIREDPASGPVVRGLSLHKVIYQLILLSRHEKYMWFFQVWWSPDMSNL